MTENFSSFDVFMKLFQNMKKEGNLLDSLIKNMRTQVSELIKTHSNKTKTPIDK
jgi:hypothetical protein